jgi:hypothetical protein
MAAGPEWDRWNERNAQTEELHSKAGNDFNLP